MALNKFPQPATHSVPNPALLNVMWEGRGFSFTAPATGSTQRIHQWGRWKVKMTWSLLRDDQSLEIIAFIERYQHVGAFSWYDPSRVTPRGTARGTVASPVGRVNNVPLVAGAGALTINFVAATRKITRAAGNVNAFQAGDEIIVSGSVSNNGTYTVESVDSAMELTVVEALVDESNTTTATVAFAELQTGWRIVTDGWPNNQAALFYPGDLLGTASTGEVYQVFTKATSDAYGNAIIELVNPILASPANDEYLPCEYVPFRMMVDPENLPPAPGVRSPVLRNFEVSLIQDIVPQ